LSVREVGRSGYCSGKGAGLFESSCSWPDVVELRLTVLSEQYGQLGGEVRGERGEKESPDTEGDGNPKKVWEILGGGKKKRN